VVDHAPHAVLEAPGREDAVDGDGQRLLGHPARIERGEVALAGLAGGA
jgi:hypothetical protein